MKCFECGAGNVERRAIHVNKELRGVDLTFFARVDVCDKCGAWEIPLDEAGSFGAELDKAYRKKLCLLSAEEIRQARRRLNMNQREFARYIGVGAASIKRWELGALQDKSSDEVIRLKTDAEYARKNLEFIRRQQGLPTMDRPESHSVFVEHTMRPTRSALYWEQVVVPMSGN